MLLAVLAVMGAAAAGAWLLADSSWAPWGAAAGAGVAVALATLIDSWRGLRLLRWLSGHQDADAPVMGGFWGELAARAERVIRKREKETRREQEQLRQFLSGIEASPNGVLMLDAGEQIEWCNQMAADHLGLDAHRDLRQRITNLVRAPAFVAHLHARNHEQSVQIPAPGGTGLISIVVRPYGDGQRLLLTQDVTARERADKTRRDFVANVSHEIRTPLTVLAGFVETMSSLPLTDVERQRVLGLMAQQTKRMQSLVGDLLALARLEDSPRPPVDQWWPLSRVGAAVEAEARGLSAGRHPLEFDWGHWRLAGSEVELQSGIGNLVNNAIRYTPEGGVIRVSAVSRVDGGLEIRVNDSGPGIAPEHLPRLAERFYRVDGSRSRETGGTGLGLSIVKHVAQRHGGELRITSELGRGSCFTLVLPAARVQASTPVEPAEPVSP
ncbi:phosphate regulon sensor histidine kinase PhoR [Ideonella sp. B508-1]|uniref:phosphate regulon sensor histidine kinase PhoR n=1 Tax=Ideonella sp. B508-1 TaxID=137716 RepID=UPI00034521C8|nr:phosphate regulon sensor histidine kinase PhoR [Ideonella sp. B508-1]